jgi:hypothetical protein
VVDAVRNHVHVITINPQMLDDLLASVLRGGDDSTCALRGAVVAGRRKSRSGRENHSGVLTVLHVLKGSTVGSPTTCGSGTVIG